MRKMSRRNNIFQAVRSKILFCTLCISHLVFSTAVSQTKLVVLGSGNPNPDPEHSGPAIAVIVDSQAYLVDFGSGIVRQAAALSPTYNGTLEALSAKRLNIAFLTHLHSDHSIGLPDLIFTPWIMGRNVPLQLWGPEGIDHMARHILEAYQEDIRYRLYGIQPANNQGWKVESHEIHHEGLVYKDELVEVVAFNVSHGTWPQCFGYRFTTKDKVIVISGDTKPSDNLIKYAKDADILVHEVYSHEGWSTKTDFWQKYHQANHTSTFELAEIAESIRPGLIVLYHTLYWGSNDEDILNEISQKYKGKVVVGHDGQIFE